MRIALCLSGQTRSLEKAAEYWKKNLIVPYSLGGDQVDIFSHTWSNLAVGYTKDIFEVYGSYVKKHDHDFAFYIDHINYKYPNVVSAQFPAVNTVSMFYSIQQANNLRRIQEFQQGWEYDIVIRGRFDFALNRTFAFQDYLNFSNQGYIWVPNDVTSENGPRDFCSDIFAFGSGKTMDKYCATFTNLDTLYDNGVKMNGEDMLSMNLNIYGLTGKKMQLLDMKNPFPPGKYNGNYHSIIRDDFTNFNTLRG